MVHSAAIQRPVIDAERCVHAFAAQASCRRCASACPHGALTLTEQSLDFDEDACTGCGHCRPACPEAAIALPGLSLTAAVDKDAREAHVACAVAIPDGGLGTVPCLHAFGERDLASLANDGVTRVRVARGSCAECVERPAVTIDDHVRAVNRLRTAHGQPALELADETPHAWQRRVVSVAAQGRTLDSGRRGFLSGLLRRPADEAPAIETAILTRFAPRIEVAACSGCDACARICPHGAISLRRDEYGLHYTSMPSACTGCGLCQDICQDGAINVEAFVPAAAMRVALIESRCTRCGVPFHQPAHGSGERADELSLCRICRAHPHPAKLFEVRS